MLARLTVAVKASPGERPPGEIDEMEGEVAWLGETGEYAEVGEDALGGGDAPRWDERGALMVGVVGVSGDMGMFALRTDPTSESGRGMLAGPLDALWVTC
jgi:hypothetical protein